MGAEQIRLAQCGEHRKERFGAADFITEKFKRVRQRVTDRETQLAQTECIQENIHLVPHKHSAVLQIAVIKAKAGIDEDFLDAIALSTFNLPREKFSQHRNRVGAQIEISHLADVFPSNVANDDGCIMGGDHAKDFLGSRSAGEVQDICARFETRARDGRLIGFDRHEDFFFAQSFDDRDQL